MFSKLLLLSAALLTFHAAKATVDIADPLESAESAFAQGRLENCLAESTEAKKYRNRRARPFFLAGLCSERLGDFDRSYKEFEKAKEIEPLNPQTYENLVGLALKRMDMAGAEKNLDEYRTRFPKDPRINSLKTLIDALKQIRAKSGKTDDELRKIMLEEYLAMKRTKASEVERK